jgi:hypothetical protein
VGVSNDEEKGLTPFQRLNYDYWGYDGKGGTKAEFEEWKTKLEEMYGVYRAFKWGFTWLIGPAGTLYILSQALQFFQKQP